MSWQLGTTSQPVRSSNCNQSEREGGTNSFANCLLTQPNEVAVTVPEGIGRRKVVNDLYFELRVANANIRATCCTESLAGLRMQPCRSWKQAATRARKTKHTPVLSVRSNPDRTQVGCPTVDNALFLKKKHEHQNAVGTRHRSSTNKEKARRMLRCPNCTEV